MYTIHITYVYTYLHIIQKIHVSCSMYVDIHIYVYVCVDISISISMSHIGPMPGGPRDQAELHRRLPRRPHGGGGRLRADPEPPRLGPCGALKEASVLLCWVQYVWMYIYMYIDMYVYIYMYIDMYIDMYIIICI